MILPDANLLICAHNKDFEQHEKAFNWWKDCLDKSREIAIPWTVSLAFLRIATSREMLTTPLSVEQTLEIIDYWLDQPHIHIPYPTTRHFSIFKNLIIHAAVAGNITTDTHLAALAIEHNFTIYSNGADFSRFRALKWKKPLM
ncbi:MAG: TA system VapC family ribonuclease toxin [Bacteroidota bacterium]